MAVTGLKAEGSGCLVGNTIKSCLRTAFQRQTRISERKLFFRQKKHVNPVVETPIMSEDFGPFELNIVQEQMLIK